GSLQGHPGRRQGGEQVRADARMGREPRRIRHSRSRRVPARALLREAMRRVSMLRRNVAAALALLGVCASVEAGELHKFEMTIEEVDLEVAPGFTTKVWAFNGQVPGPLIHVREGDELEVTVHNLTTMNHTIHWHGQYQRGTWQSDGVPNVTQKPIEPGESYTYRFVAEKPGSLWYHCHVNVAEHVGLRGMWGPLIVDPKNPTELEKEVTVDAIAMFSGWNSEVANEYGTGGKP